MVSPGVRDLLARGTLLQRFAVLSCIVIAMLGLVMGYLLSRQIESNALDAATAGARDIVTARLLPHLDGSDVGGARYDRQHAQKFARFLRDNVYGFQTVRVKVWDTNGRVVYSDDTSLIGRRFPMDDDLREALQGRTAEDISDLASGENVDERRFGRLLEVYIPIVRGGRVYGAFEIYQRYDPVARQIRAMQVVVYKMLAGGLVALYLLLFGLVRSGSRTITEQQHRLRRYTAQLEVSYKDTIASLAAAVDARDHSTERHSQRVTELSVALARYLGLSEEEIQTIERGALLHDVGKIGISDGILLKPGALTECEWTEMRRHPDIGYRMLSSIAFVRDALPIVRYHHERWDGAGYPCGLAGEEIPYAARLFAIIDAYDAMTSTRPYRRGLPHDVAMERLRHAADSHFDPALVAAFDAMMRERMPAAEAIERWAVG